MVVLLIYLNMVLLMVFCLNIFSIERVCIQTEQKHYSLEVAIRLSLQIFIYLHMISVRVCARASDLSFNVPDKPTQNCAFAIFWDKRISYSK